MPLSRDEEDAYNDYVRHFRRNVLPQMEESAFVMSLLPDRDGVDVKFATELGMAIMLGKPIMAIAQPGTEVPDSLRAVVSEVIELDADVDTEEGRAEIGDRVKRFTESLGEPDE